MDVLMPQLGETVAEGKITKWFKQAGDEVKPGENLFEIETDKTSMEVPSTVAGKLTAINVRVGDVARVGAVVAVIGGQVGQVKAAASPPLAPAKATAQSQPIPVRAALGSRLRRNEREEAGSFAYSHMHPFREVRTPERNYGPARVGGRQVSPLARRLASERGIDLASIKGSGPHGRIVASDVGSAVPKGAAAEAAPHLYLIADIEIGRLLALCAEANAATSGDKSGGAAFSPNDFVVKAWAAALQRVPAANAIWAGDRILRSTSSDIGVVMALDDGAITPIVRNAEAKSLTAISGEIRDLSARARDNKLEPAEYQGGVSAVSNLGTHGMREFAAIIKPPHATILAVGAPRRAATEAADGSVKFVSVMTVTLSCDHRVLDEAHGAQLLAVFKALLENPITALI
jgi:pyruvate dehydrogenase E2 component (dihydrolipoamide acetyltransferase)